LYLISPIQFFQLVKLKESRQFLKSVEFESTTVKRCSRMANLL
jgi:hypothetical protein